MKFCYRSLKGWKYETTTRYEHQTEIKGFEIYTSHIILDMDGLLGILPGYAWDGASGPTVDTRNSMRASLVHDALYQLMRLSLLPDYYRHYADNLFHEICIADGMWQWRAWIWYQAVRWFASPAAWPGTEKERKIICV